MRTSKATRSLTGKLLRPLVVVAVWAMVVVSPALAIDLFNPGIPPFPDGLSPTFNTRAVIVRSTAKSRLAELRTTGLSCKVVHHAIELK